VLFNTLLVGEIIKTNSGQNSFKYDDHSSKHYSNDFITFTVPITNLPSLKSASFFDRLIPEDWQTNIASED
jgi:serine/threonine-protein kinase HipA